MKFARSFTIVIHKIIDQGLPPFLRDSRLLFTFLFSVLFRDQAKTFLEFKDIANKLSEKEFSQVYEKVAAVSISRETDLNDKSLTKVLESIRGKNVLEVGCGKGFLANKISNSFPIIACDIVIDKAVIKKYKKVRFRKANIEKLPFKDKSFDTVVSTHTLEHVLHIHKAIDELRRVTKKRLIIVVPQQRPYKYTFDLHLHFFPYPFALLSMMGNQKNSICEEVGGDLVYVEDYK